MEEILDAIFDGLPVNLADVRTECGNHMNQYPQLLRQLRILRNEKNDTQEIYDEAFAGQYAAEKLADPKAGETATKTKINAHPNVAPIFKRLNQLQIELDAWEYTFKAVQTRAELLKALLFADSGGVRAAGLAATAAMPVSDRNAADAFINKHKSGAPKRTGKV